MQITKPFSPRGWQTKAQINCSATEEKRKLRQKTLVLGVKQTEREAYQLAPPRTE